MHNLGRRTKDAVAILGSLTPAATLAMAVACSDSEPASQRPNAVDHQLTPAQEAVLGFERPTLDWSVTSGALAESTTVSQGAKALALNPTGWTEITSIPLASLGQVRATASFDVRLPAAAGWGEVRLVLVAPSLQLSWLDLGGRNLSTLTPGQYSTVSFPVPAQAQAALAGSYTDLRIKLIVNGPVLGTPYLFDNLLLAQGNGPTPPADGPRDLSLVVPTGETRESTFLSSSDFLQVDDRVEVGVAGKLAAVASLGVPPGVEFGSSLNAHANLYSLGRIWLRSQSSVDGFARTQNVVDLQDATVVLRGAEQEGYAIPARVFSHAVQFPPNPAALNTVEQGANLVLDPGAYQHLDVHGGNVFLRAGTYYFDSIETEPAGQLRVDNFLGPVVIYVKNTFVHKGPIVESGAREAQTLVGYFGTTPANLEAAFIGTVVAPNAEIELRRPAAGKHRGSFFGKRIHVFSDSQILHVPFEWDSLPGGDQPPDTDGDGKDDLSDPCVLDGDKADPLLCGCNREETDTDGDEIPDCLDRCPNDPGKSHAGACGCLNEGNLQPAGTPCVVEACAGSRQTAACDGQGQCGEPACPPITDGGCFHKVFRDSVYWFCPGPVSWNQAEAACNQEPGRSLVRVDDRIENAWIGRVSSGVTWLGGNDLSEEHRWRWARHDSRDGRPFWNSGLPVPGRYANWAFGKPDTQDCLVLQDGVWSDADCSTSHGFVCEQPLLYVPPALGPIDKCDFFPGLTCGDDDEPPTGACVEASTLFPSDPNKTREQNQADAEAIAVACEQNCTSPDDPDCATYCTGFASVPPPGTCRPFTAEQRVLCDLVNIHPDPNVTCSKESPSCPSGYTCGRRRECAVLYDNAPRPCDGDEDCDAGHFCGSAVRVCIDPNKHSKCDDKVGDECVGLCFGSFACGQVEEKCAANDATDPMEPCSDTHICPDENTTELDTNPINDAASNLTPVEFPADQIFPEPEEAPSSYPEAKPVGCGGPSEPPCSYGIGQHPWCNYQVDPAETPSPKAVSDADQFGNKQGTGGGAGPIRFDFDPNLSVVYDVKDPLPLGDSKFEASATASATASAHFSLFGIGGDVSILDALGTVAADRCGLEADARLKLFGYDFLPVLLGDSYDDIDALSTSPEHRQTCADAIADFQEAVNRAQKALRDAQELIRQQKQAIADGKRLQTDLCEELLAQASKGLPANFPSPNAPFQGCNGITPEETINLFIQYYKQQVYALVAKQAAVLRDGLPEFPSFSIDFLDRYEAGGSVDQSRRETQQIANITFAIGPIPMNLTIEAFVQYGMAGELSLSLTPDRLIEAYQSDSQVELANVDATLTPFAGAGISMFLGAGFDFGALSAKVGIAGDVSLGVVSVPLYAGAGIGMQPEVDTRPYPSDLENMLGSAQLLYPKGPPRKFRFDAFYKFGANATISNILSGTIFGKLRIKFFFFSKTWAKKIVEFASPFDPINLPLIHGEGGAEFADDFGILGRVRMPVPFVDLKPLEPPPPLPPLPQPSGGAGGGGAGGSGGSNAGGAGGSGGTGNRPPVSLLVLNDHTGDPRYVHLDKGRVDEFFYSGYCECSNDGACDADLDCCGGNFCVQNDATQTKSCAACVSPTTSSTQGGQQCQSSGQCCQTDPARPNVCSPLTATGQTKYCQACKQLNVPVLDADNDGVADFGDCCPGLGVFRGPDNQPVCSGSCRDPGDSCNTDLDCCDTPNRDYFCNEEKQCEGEDVVK